MGFGSMLCWSLPWYYDRLGIGGADLCPVARKQVFTTERARGPRSATEQRGLALRVKWLRANWFHKNWIQENWFGMNRFRATWFRVMWFQATWFRATWFRVMWLQVTWFRATWFRATWLQVTWFQTTPKSPPGQFRFDHSASRAERRFSMPLRDPRLSPW
jgi:hypothetical protein